MDTLIYSVLRITVLVLIMRTLFRLFSYPRSKAFLFNQKSKNEDLGAADQPADEQPASIEAEEPEVEMVMDEICQKEIPRHQAYILLDDENRHLYFSSWECRQKYLDSKSAHKK